MTNSKYTEALNDEIKLIDKENPFNKSTEEENQDVFENDSKSIDKKFHYEEKVKSNSYFNLILDSSYNDIEMEIRGLRYMYYNHPKTGKKIIELERKKNHFLSEEGAEYLLTELKLHTSTDLKLGFITDEEYKRTMDIFINRFVFFMKQNTYNLGMDTEEKARKGVMITIAIINRIKFVYSRSIEGRENKRSHGDITLSGNLEGEREAKFDLDGARN